MPSTFPFVFFSSNTIDLSGDGICVDTGGFVDTAGYTCGSNIGVDCSDANLFVNEWGHALEAWQDIMENCVFSCGLCEGIISSFHTKTGLLSFNPNPCDTKTGLLYF